MLAVSLQRLGGPERLVPIEVPDPAPGPGQVLIDVAFAGVTFVETQVRAGRGPFQVDPPTILGNGVGGVVRALGPDVDPAALGARVVSSTGGTGGYAERAVVDAAGFYEVPEGLALDAAVALLADGRTATLLVEQADIRAGERVLVEAAAGGVGSLLVQLVAARDAVVIAAAGGHHKRSVARDLGASVAVDYHEPSWPEQIRSAVGGVDVVLDGVGGDIGRTAFELIRPGGRMLSYGLASGSWTRIEDTMAAQRQVELLRLSPTTDELRDATVAALRAGATGSLTPLIGQRFPLAQAASAHHAIETRATVGKTLLEVRAVDP